MKKILFFDANDTTVDLIQLAKSRGYYTISCDNKKDNAGHRYSDKQYYESTYDIEKLEDIVRSEKIDGMVYYTSGHGLYAASHLVDKFNLPGISFSVINSMSDKDKFRQFLCDNQLPHPLFNVFDEPADNYLINFDFPVIVKPVDSGGNRGITKVENQEDLRTAAEYAFSQSLCGKIIVEQFIESDLQINGDCLIENGKVRVAFLGKYLYNSPTSIIPYATIFSTETINPLDRERIVSTIQHVVDKACIKDGVLNVELRVDKHTAEVYFIEINTRHSGNRIYLLMNNMLDVSTEDWAISLSVGEPSGVKEKINETYYCAYCILYSKENGVLTNLEIDPKLLQYTIEHKIFVSQGDDIRAFERLQDRLALLHLKFDSQEEMMNIIGNIENYYKVELK